MSYYSLYQHEKPFTDLLGKTLSAIQKIESEDGNDELRFITEAGETYLMYHAQDCCESVGIESITGDLQDLIGLPILRAEVATSDTRPADVPAPEYQDESETWTFYKLATAKGYVDIRWYGSSNGYYSEGVDFALLPAII